MSLKDNHALFVFALVALVGLGGLLLSSGPAPTGNAFAYPMEGGFGQGEINWPTAAKTLMYECTSPFPGKSGEFQKAAYAYDARTASWLQDRYGFKCTEV